MTDASTFHRSSTALVVQGLQNDVVTEGGAFVASGAPAHGHSKIVLTGWITIRGGVLGSDHDRRAGRGTGTDEEHYPERRPPAAAPARPAARAQSAPPA
jgi:hypothetical protein